MSIADDDRRRSERIAADLDDLCQHCSRPLCTHPTGVIGSRCATATALAETVPTSH